MTPLPSCGPKGQSSWVPRYRKTDACRGEERRHLSARARGSGRGAGVSCCPCTQQSRQGWGQRPEHTVLCVFLTQQWLILALLSDPLVHRGEVTIDHVLHSCFTWCWESGGPGRLSADCRVPQRSGCWSDRRPAPTTFSKDSRWSYACLCEGAENLNRLFCGY